MNPLIKRQLDEIEGNLDALGAALARAKEDSQEGAKEREGLLKDQWRQRKELATVQRITDDYDALEAENARLKETLAQLRERLARVREFTKALQAEFHS